MSFITKYRPTEFSDFVGTYPDLLALVKIGIQTFIFYSNDTPGVGKTSMARAFIKELKAEANSIEINAAVDNGIDFFRDLVNSLRYKLPIGQKKVIVLDEAHKITSQAWDALKIVMESPPEGVYLIFCTTDVSKIPKINESRCKKIFFPDIASKYLETIIRNTLKFEGETLEEVYIDNIVESAKGSARVALLTLASVLASEPKDRLLASKGENNEELPEIKELCQAIYFSPAKINSILKNLKKTKGVDADGIRRAIFGYGAALLLNDKDVTNKMQFFEEPFLNGFNDLVYSCNLTKEWSKKSERSEKR